MVKTSITSKGQTTIPVEIRRLWHTSEVIWETCDDGSARVRPLPDVLSLFGSASSAIPRDPAEKRKARAAIGEQANKPGRKP